MTSGTGPARGNSLTYRDAGVDIDAGNALVDAIKPLARSTFRPGANGELGGFGGLFDPKAAGYRDPVMLAATDGVGTKLMLAIEADRHDTVGIDLVAMCVNDLVVQGADPMVFLDYFACGKLEPEATEAVISGIAEGCRQAGAALIGGETAEMPGMYEAGHYDLAGFAVGVVERDSILDGTHVSEGDRLLGLASSGVHSNGFSLVRKVAALERLGWDDAAPFAGDITLGAALLAPTRIYVRPLLKAIAAGGVHALCHITGGGFFENLPRVLPPELACRITSGSWPYSPVFGWLESAGGIDRHEMMRTFNCGIGMIAVVAPDRADDLRDLLEQGGEAVFEIGEIVPRGENRPVEIRRGET